MIYEARHQPPLHRAQFLRRMLLGGMGPIHFPKTEAGKLFAGFFALYAGLVFIAAAAVLLAPTVHRLLHHFHWSASRDD